MKKIVDWINSHKIITICIALALFVVQPIAVHWMFKTKAATPFWEKTWDAGDLLGYVAGFEAFIGTVFLGVVAARQNDRANDISERLLNHEEERAKLDRKPLVYLVDVHYKTVRLSDVLDSYENTFLHSSLLSDDNGNVIVYSIKIKNVSKICLELLFRYINLHYIAGSKDIKIDGLSINSKSNIFFLPPDEFLSFHFAVNTSDFFFNFPTSVDLCLKLRNPIGESYITNISFYSLGRPSDLYFYQTSYDHQLETKKTN